MKEFAGKLAVITGAGSGMGRELALALATSGCHLALCDVQLETLNETRTLCAGRAPAGTRISVSACDVSDEQQVLAFRDDALREHGTKHINLLFNNAGIGGAGSFIRDSRAEWERTFGVCWGGVYLCTRAFMPLLVASDEGHIVNVSSVNGFWACLGPGQAHTAYSSAKFAVKGFTEALLIDTRLNAPHVKVSLVMPGHIGTSIMENSRRLLGRRAWSEMTAEELAPVRANLTRQGVDAAALTDDMLRAAMQRFASEFRERAPTSAAEAAAIILDGVREERWRILVGEDAEALDALVRGAPDQAYELSFPAQLGGRMRGLGVR